MTRRDHRMPINETSFDTAVPETARPPSGDGRRWVALAVLILPTLVISMDATVTYLAIPSISRALLPSAPEILWITDIYGFLQAGFLITMGSLGDRVGRRKMLLAGALVFALASFASAFSATAWQLIVCRGLLGLSGAAIATSILSLIRYLFQGEKERRLAIGLWTTCFSVGTMLGPLAGGVLLNRFPWGAVYLLGLPAMALLLALGPALLPRSVRNREAPFDPAGSALSVAAILLVIYGIKQLAAYGRPGSLLPLACGVLAGAACLRRLRRGPSPFIDVSLLGVRTCGAALLMLMAALFCWAGIQLFVAQYFQLAVGLDPFRAGLWTIPSAAGGAFGCLLAPRVARLFAPRWVMWGAMLLLAVGLGGIAQAASPSGFALVIAGGIILSVGCGIIVTLGTDVVLGAVPVARAGAAAGISETSANLGAALGIALMGSLGTVIYRHEITAGKAAGFSRLVPERARSTLEGALAGAGALPARAAEAWERAARAAFMHALVITAAVAALFMLMLTAGVTWRWAREKAPQYRVSKPA